IAAAANKPAMVGMMTLPSQFVRLSNPFERFTGSPPILISRPWPGPASKWPMARVIENRTHNRQSCCFRQDRPCEKVPGRCQHVGGCELRPAIPTLKKLDCAGCRQQKHGGHDGPERAVPLGRIECSLQHAESSEHGSQSRNHNVRNETAEARLQAR